MKQIVVTKRRAVIWIVTALAVFLVMVGGLWASRQFGFLEDTSEPVGLLPVDKVRALALSHQGTGDIDGGLKVYDDQISAVEDDKIKRELLLYKADFALENKRNDAALDAARRAERIDSNTTTDRLLARIYEAMGNKRKSLSYYKKVLDAMPEKTEGLGGRERPVLEAKIEELGK